MESIFAIKKKLKLLYKSFNFADCFDVAGRLGKKKKKKVYGKIFFIPPPPKQQKITPKRGELFSFFEIFTAEFSHFLVTKKNVFLVTKK